MFDHAVREHLNRTARRRMAVLRPLKVVIENYPEGAERRAGRGQPPRGSRPPATRQVPFARELYIERDDFMETPPKKFFRLAPGREVRLRYAYFITCREVVKNAAGDVIELRCTYDPATRGGNAPDGRKVRGTIHWVAAAHSLPAEIRLYNPLFTRPDPGAEGDFFADLNPDSLEILGESRVEPALAEAPVGEAVQFERQGYFCLDPDVAARSSCLSTEPSACATAGPNSRPPAEPHDDASASGWKSRSAEHNSIASTPSARRQRKSSAIRLSDGFDVAGNRSSTPAGAPPRGVGRPVCQRVLRTGGFSLLTGTPESGSAGAPDVLRALTYRSRRC